MPRELPKDFPRTLGSLLDRQSAAIPDRIAVSSDGLLWTYGQLREEADRVAAALVAAGVTKGTRVGVLLPNWPAWLACAFGAAKVGALAVGLNTLHRLPELEYSLHHTDIAILISARRFLRNDYEAMLSEITGGELHGRIAPRLPQLRRVVWLEAEGDRSGVFGEFLAAGDRVSVTELDAIASTVRPSDPAVVCFTSGSTAAPKAAVLSHAALTYSAWTIGDHLGLTPDDRTWATLPLFFSGGLCLCALSSLAAGARVVLNAAFEPGAALEKLEREQCTVMVGYNHAAAMLEHPSFAAARLSLRKGVGGNLELADRFLGPDHVTVGNYGMTETATICCSARHSDPPAVRRTFGRPIPGASVRIVEPVSGVDVAPGEEGEILVRSPAQMTHYYGMSAKDCFDDQGYFHTGDLGYFDTEGCLHFAKRLKDVIKTMGVNVAAPEVERYLEGHPAVRRAAVVGVSDVKRGENVVAFIVAAPGSVTSEDLQRFCREGLAPYKIPRRFILCRDEDLPVSASGKLEKGRLRERAEKAIRETEA